MNNRKLADNYNRWYKNQRSKIDIYPQTISFYKNIIDNLMQILPSNNSSILDIACGKGLFLNECKKSGLKIYGIDISSRATSFARKLLKGNIKIGSAESLPYTSKKFNYITCIGSLEHFNDPLKAIKEMKRVLKSDGVISLHVPNLMFIGHIYMALRYGEMPTEGDQSFSEEPRTYLGWKRLIEKGGFKIVKCDRYNDIFVSKRVPPLISYFWMKIFRYIIPFNLSYSFIYYCKKKS